MASAVGTKRAFSALGDDGTEHNEWNNPRIPPSGFGGPPQGQRIRIDGSCKYWGT